MGVSLNGAWACVAENRSTIRTGLLDPKGFTKQSRKRTVTDSPTLLRMRVLMAIRRSWQRMRSELLLYFRFFSPELHSAQEC